MAIEPREIAGMVESSMGAGGETATNINDLDLEVELEEDQEDEEDSDSSSLDSKLEILSIPEIGNDNDVKPNIDIDINEDMNINANDTNIKYVMDPFNDTVDYKKLTVYNLRSIVKQKGLVEDPSKMKKQDLLQLLTNE